MNKFLFYHYGPGGNSFGDEKILSMTTNAIEFWDQPKTQDEQNPYNELVGLCKKRLDQMSSPTGVIGHSFGCNLILSLCQLGLLNNLKIVLISPLRNTPIAFLNLAKGLLLKQNISTLAASVSNFENSNNLEKSFWELVGHIVTHPHYNSSFWSNDKCMATYLSYTQDARPFDAREWQVLMHNYLFKTPMPAFDVLKNYNIHIIMGENDPYLTQEDFQYWETLVGKNRVSIIPDTSHFPHLENPTSLTPIINF